MSLVGQKVWEDVNRILTAVLKISEFYASERELYLLKMSFIENSGRISRSEAERAEEGRKSWGWCYW